MRIARFISENDPTARTPRYAFVQADKADGKDYLVVLDGYPLSGQQVSPTGERIALDAEGVRLLSPVIPSKVIGVGLNYDAHNEWFEDLTDSENSASASAAASEASATPAPTSASSAVSSAAASSAEIVVFMKPSTAVIGPDDPIVYPRWTKDLNYEPELAVVMGRIARNVSEADAMKYVLGYTCVNDVTARDIQQSDTTWFRGKGFDTSCPLGPWIETDVDSANAQIHLSLNGADVPDAAGTTANLIHPVPALISYISQFTTLLPGDVIMTGTPAGSGALKPGDECVVTIDGLGSLRNVVVSA
jgi:2-keto-4-pentenoate hydratase/2-oxohepta-3-ene-1,7-dioic acid hydratase in catechol pathway